MMKFENGNLVFESDTEPVIQIGKRKRYILLFGKLRKFKWYHIFLFMIPKRKSTVPDINTEEFKNGDKLYLGENGCLTNKKII